MNMFHISTESMIIYGVDLIFLELYEYRLDDFGWE